MVPPRKPPQLKLDASVFTSANTTAPKTRQRPRGIFDTHIHLWTYEQRGSGALTWPWDLSDPKEAALAGQHSADDYNRVVAHGIGAVTNDKSSTSLDVSEAGAGGEGAIVQQKIPPSFAGAVFVQAEAAHDDTDVDGSNGGWDAALDEVNVVCKSALEDKGRTIKAMVPWAPVHHGRAALERYLERLRASPPYQQWCQSAQREVVTSVRFLLQDCPQGFFLEPSFIEGLRYLGQQGIAFDMTLDSVKQWDEVLDDAATCISQVWRGVEDDNQKTRFILDHFGKPPLTLPLTSPPHPHHTAYIRSLFELSLLGSRVAIKLSGLLDCLEEETVRSAFVEFCDSVGKGCKGDNWKELKRRVASVVEPAVEAFGVERIIVGSDWPMLRARLFPASAADSQTRDPIREGLAWAFETELYRSTLVEFCGLDGDALDKVFEHNGREFYRIPAVNS